MLGAGTWSANVIITTSLSGEPTLGVPVDVTVVQEGGPPAIESVLNAASFVLATSTAPGEVLSIFGTNMGPVIPLGLQLDSTGKVSTTLGGVSVYFSAEASLTLYEQYAAPLTYVSATQINCVLPYEVAQLMATPWPGIVWIQVHYLDRFSTLIYPATYNMHLTPASPAIFTTTGTGTGQAAALNSDNSPNTASNPALAGSTIAVFMTGEGQTTPAGVTGSVTCSSGCATTDQIPKPLLPVAASVNGQPATVAFYGEAPGLVAGVMQVNVTIPPYTRAGAASLSITVGSNSTQSGITVAVK
jgi:uncharacterized protein (TIGR03437 family)